MLDVASSLDDQYIAASASDSNRIHLFRTDTGAKFETYAGHSDLVTSVRFNYSRKGLISAGKDNTIRMWNIATTQHMMTQSPSRINNIDLTWSETILATTHMRDIRFWNLTSGTA